MIHFLQVYLFLMLLCIFQVFHVHLYRKCMSIFFLSFTRLAIIYNWSSVHWHKILFLYFVNGFYLLAFLSLWNKYIVSFSFFSRIIDFLSFCGILLSTNTICVVDVLVFGGWIICSCTGNAVLKWINVI